MATVRFEGNSLTKVFITLECSSECAKHPASYPLDEVIGLGYPRCTSCGNPKNVVLKIEAPEGSADEW